MRLTRLRGVGTAGQANRGTRLRCWHGGQASRGTRLRRLGGEISADSPVVLRNWQEKVRPAVSGRRSPQVLLHVGDPHAVAFARSATFCRRCENSILPTPRFQPILNKEEVRSVFGVSWPTPRSRKAQRRYRPTSAEPALFANFSRVCACGNLATGSQPC